jgi:hypothetical protein
MNRTLRLLSMASLLATGVATAGLAAGNDAGGGSSPTVTGTRLGSPQESTPATGSSGTATTGTYGMNSRANPNGSSYPGGVGPTGSTQPDATNPSRPTPSGGGGNSR